MKMSIRTALVTLAIAALAACGSEKAPDTAAPEGTTVPAGEDWTAKPDSGVNVNLPETPVTTETATPPPAAGDSKDANAPAAPATSE
jgi:hypothetical protein